MSQVTPPDSRAILLAAAISLPGTVLLAAGLYALFVPGAAEVLPALAQPMVGWALVAAGLIIETAAAIFMISILRRARGTPTPRR